MLRTDRSTRVVRRAAAAVGRFGRELRRAALRRRSGDADAWSDALLDAGAQSIDIADPHAGTVDESPLYDEPGAAPASWPVSRITALFARADDLAKALASLSAAGRELPPHETSRSRRAGLGARDAGAVRAHPDRATGYGSFRRGAIPSTRPRSTLRSIPASRSAPGRIRRRGFAFNGSRASCTPANRSSTMDAGPAFLRSPRAAWERRASSEPISIHRRLLQAKPTHGAIAWRRRSCCRIDSPPTRRRGSMWSLPTFWQIRCACSRPSLPRASGTRGRILLSGILEAQADSLIAVYRRWFNIGVCESEDGWITLAGTRRSRARSR